MSLQQIKVKMEQAFARDGVVAEVTFIRINMFSIFCEDADNFAKAKRLLEHPHQKFDSEDCDPEVGYFAYYRF